MPLHFAFVQPVFHCPAFLLNFVPARAGEYQGAVKPVGFDCDDVPFWRHMDALALFVIAVLLKFVDFNRYPSV